MSATKILWEQIVIVFAIVLATMWAATQWVAWKLGYQPQLGHPWFELISGVPIYLPPSFFWWWYAYDAYAPQVFVEGAYIASSGGFIAVAVAVAMSVWRAREAKTAATYGSARWATRQEIRAAGLIAPDGVVLGQFEGDYLRHDGPEHVLCFAPTRSGKGVGLVVPTLLTWPASCIVHDIKGENWILTSGFRAQHGRVLLFDPTNAKSAAYNPLLEVRRGEWEVRDVQNVADVLVDPEGSLERRNHWEKTSHALLVGAILHVLYAEPDKTLAGVAGFLSDPKRPIEVTLRAMMTTAHLGEAGPHPVIASAARELLNKSENERSGVLSTAMSFLGLYRDPVVAKVTHHCDWRIRDLVEGRTVAFEGTELSLPWSGHWKLPVWVAGYGPLALKMTGRVADGVILQLADPDLVAWFVGQVRAAAVAAGRAPDDVQVQAAAPADFGELAECRERTRWFPALVSNHVVDLVNRLEGEARAGRQGRLADYLTRLDFIVLDELGYLPFAQTGGQLLFHLISRLYEVDPDHAVHSHGPGAAVMSGSLPLEAPPPRR